MVLARGWADEAKLEVNESGWRVISSSLLICMLSRMEIHIRVDEEVDLLCPEGMVHDTAAAGPVGLVWLVGIRVLRS